MSSATVDSAVNENLTSIPITSTPITSKPFKSLNELYTNLNNLTPWPAIKELQKNTDYIYSGKDINDVRKPLRKFEKTGKPKTLVCHDMKGGYLDDRFIDGSEASDSYVFYHWSVVDTFVYFSHSFITIPPYGWINAAHIHGVKILGTIITEWDDGAKIWDDIFKSELETIKFADAIIQVTKFYKFDGWLLNVENRIKETDIEKLKFFVKYLTDNIHREIQDSEIIWYDSVTRAGKLSWQNQLNDLNKCFFDLCDGIFLNYNWTDSGLSQSAEKVEHENRITDIYVGLDVWGRGCPGGGGFNSNYALKKIREKDMSVAIFGAGWTHEHFGTKSFEDIENLFWAQLFPHLYIHVLLYDDKTFETSFSRGVGLNNYHLGQRQIGAIIEEDGSAKDQPFYNLSAQYLQLSVPTPDLEFLTEENKNAEQRTDVINSNMPNGSNKSNAIDPFLDPNMDSKIEIKSYETGKSVIQIQGNRVTFQNKPNSVNLNNFQFNYNCAFNGGACLELVTRNVQLYHRLFILQVNFEFGIQASLVYRMDPSIPDLSEPKLVIGNDNNLKSIVKYRTEELQFPWRKNLYLTNFTTITQIGVAASKQGIISLGEIVVEEKQPALGSQHLTNN